MTDGDPAGSPRPPVGSSATAAVPRRRKAGCKGSSRAAARETSGTREESKLRELFVKAVAQFPFKISPSIRRRLFTAVDLLEDRPADLSPFLGTSDALDIPLIQDTPLLREWTVELLFQLLTVLAICGLAFAVGITIGSIVCRTTLFSGSAITGLYVEKVSEDAPDTVAGDQPHVTLLLPRTDGWSAKPTVTAVLIGRFNLSLPEYSLGSYVEALSAVLTLTYLPAVHIGRDAATCFGNWVPPQPTYVRPSGDEASPRAKTAGSDGSGRSDRSTGAPPRRTPSARGPVGPVPTQAAGAEAGAAAGSTASAGGAEGGTGPDLSGEGGLEGSSSREEVRARGGETNPREQGLSHPRNDEGSTPPRRLAAHGNAHVVPPVADKVSAGRETPRRLSGKSDHPGAGPHVRAPRFSPSHPSSPPSSPPPLPLSLSPLQRRWRARHSAFMHRYVAAAAEHLRRSRGGTEMQKMPGTKVDEGVLLRTAAAGGSDRLSGMLDPANYVLVRRAIESLSLLSRSSVETRQPLRVSLYDPVTGTSQEQSLMLLRHSAAAGFPVELLEQAAVEQGELPPTLLFRSILPFVVGLGHGLNKVEVTASINVPLVEENKRLLEALQKDCALQRVYFSLEVTLQAVRAMFFKQTHGKRVLEPFHVLCTIRHLADETAWPPPPPKSFVYDVADLAAEYASLSVGFGSTP